MNNDKNPTGHLCMFAACAAWGLMAPLEKDAMAHGISGMTMACSHGLATLPWAETGTKTWLETAKSSITLQD